jgi:anti-anti-sigma regulatory factor
LAVQSGCYSLFVGIESLDQQNLLDVHKRVNRVEQYDRALRTLRDHGITIAGSFIFGLDHDDEGVFERTVRFCERNEIELPIFFILTPIPATPIYRRMEAEGRLLSRDWERYDGMHVVYRPRLMTPETLQQGFQWACQDVYSWRSIWRRILLHPRRRVVPHLGLNLAFRRIAHRVPKGQLSPLSRMLRSLNDAVPIRDVRNLLPTLPEEVLQKGRTWVRESYGVLRIRATYHEPLKTVFFQLEGAMDLASAKALIRKVSSALDVGQRIIIDFERVHHLSPTAANLLLKENLERLQAWRDRIQLVHLTERVQGALGNVRAFLDQRRTAEEGGAALEES